jgi:hypothetical protein
LGTKERADNLNEVYSIDLSDFQEFSLILKKSIFKYMKKGRKSKTPKCFCKSMNGFNSIYPKLQKSSLDATPVERDK